MHDALSLKVELIRPLSRPSFHRHFEGKDRCFATAYEDGVEGLAAAVDVAVAGEEGWDARLSAGLSAGLDFLAAAPPLAYLLLVEALAASRLARLEHERSLLRLAAALRPPGSGLRDGEGDISEETARLLAGGLVSHLSGRVLAGEAERLAESHELLLGYLLSASSPATSRSAGECLAEGR